MSKQDITMYGEQELSLLVLNTEYLYRAFRRADCEGDLRALACDFKYTTEQFEELVSDMEEDMKEREPEEDRREYVWARPR